MRVKGERTARSTKSATAAKQPNCEDTSYRFRFFSSKLFRKKFNQKGGGLREKRSFSLKGQQQALSVILISGILIGVVSSVYFWGLPLIQKNRDISLQKNSEVFMKNLAEKFKFVANHGGSRERLSINVPGNVVFDPVTKTLELTIETQGTTYETGTWIQLSKNGCTIENGRWGIDEPETLCVMSTGVGDSYTTIYRLSFVQLNTEALTSYRIDMVGTASSGSEGHVVIVQNTGTQTVTENNRNVAKTTLNVGIEV